MNRVIASLLFGAWGISLACAEKGDDAMENTPSASKVTQEYLLAHGFKQSATDSDIFSLEKVRLGHIARKLGFLLADLRPIPNQPRYSDQRTIAVRNLIFVVESEVRDKDGNVIQRSLDSPDAICTVSVSLDQVPVQEYRKTDSAPRLRIKSVTMPKDRLKPLMISFELAADGKTPIAVSQKRFCVRLTAGKQPPAFLDVSFPKDTPGAIIAAPGKPVTVTVSAATNQVTGGRWSDLPSVEYVMSVAIVHEGKLRSHFDYNWTGEKYSDEYKLIIK